MSPQHIFDRAGQLLRAGKMEEAERLLTEGLARDADNVAGNQMLGMVRFRQNRLSDALFLFERAIARGKDFATLSNLGTVLQGMGRFEEALANYAAALELEPNNAVLLYNHGRVLQDLGRFGQALVSYEKAVALNPSFANAWNNRGNVLRSLRYRAEAKQSYDRALALNPNYAEALYNRGNFLWAENHDYHAAIRDLEKAFALDPTYDYLPGEIFYLRLHGADWRDFDSLRARIREGVRAGHQMIQPFQYQAVSDSPADQQSCAIRFARDRFPAMPPLQPKPRQGLKIRLGYVCGEFREHATAYLTAGLFERHDRQKFSLIGFDNGWDDGSVIRARLTGAFDAMIDISGLSDRQAAEKIRDQQIDILVNLNGSVGLHRMGVFAYRPAPIQVNYLGCPATTGAPYMDYILADGIVIPQNEERYFTEKVVALPDSYQINDRKRSIAATAPSRAECHLPDDALVFLQFQQWLQIDAGNVCPMDGHPEAGAEWRIVAFGKQSGFRRQSASRGNRGRHRPRAAGVRADDALGPTSGAADFGRPVSGPASLRRAYHGQRCVVGWPSLAHLPWYDVSRPRGGKSSGSSRTSGADRTEFGGISGPGARSGLRSDPAFRASAHTEAKPPYQAVVRHRPHVPAHRGRIHRHARNSSAR
jgi:predicted O-linked N-acetylglucosamine transferase (SPINDLY family)